MRCQTTQHASTKVSPQIKWLHIIKLLCTQRLVIANHKHPASNMTMVMEHVNQTINKHEQQFTSSLQRNLHNNLNKITEH
eukprot:gene3275-2257_t